MSASTPKIRNVVIAMGAALLTHVAVAAAQQPTSLLELFNRIPKAPATIQEAAERAGQNPSPLAALKAELKAHDAAVAKIAEAASSKAAAAAGVPTGEQVAQGAAKGGAVAGIDVARMQKDPAYAKEMQAKMKAMSPQELMAMTAAMTQAMGLGGGRVAVSDTPAVQAVADAGQAYANQASARSAAHQQRWAEVEKQVEAATAKALVGAVSRPPGCDGEGGGRKECVDGNNRYVSVMLPKKLARDTEILRLMTAALEAERAAMLEEVRTADRQLQAVQYGAASQTMDNPLKIVGYDQGVQYEIGVLADKLDEIVKRTSRVTSCLKRDNPNARTDCAGM